MFRDGFIITLVRHHGQLIGQAYEAEVEELLHRPDLTELKPVLVATHQPRYRAGWPEALTAAVDTALAEENPRSPQGVCEADSQPDRCARCWVQLICRCE